MRDLNRRPNQRLSVRLTMGVVMAALAVGRAVDRLSTGTLSAAIGALLFLTSDVILAVDRFRRPFQPDFLPIDEAQRLASAIRLSITTNSLQVNRVLHPALERPQGPRGVKTRGHGERGRLSGPSPRL